MGINFLSLFLITISHPYLSQILVLLPTLSLILCLFLSKLIIPIFCRFRSLPIYVEGGICRGRTMWELLHLKGAKPFPSSLKSSSVLVSVVICLSQIKARSTPGFGVLVIVMMILWRVLM
ncbi:hypothetical protein AMTRI_Chr01g132100 [Amborella trichopoda]